jgi:hypothetical protein
MKEMTLDEYIESQEWPIIAYLCKGADKPSEEAVDGLPGLHSLGNNGHLRGCLTGNGRWIWSGNGKVVADWLGAQIISMTAYSDEMIWTDLAHKNWLAWRPMTWRFPQ